MNLLISEDSQTLNTAIFFLRRGAWSEQLLKRAPRTKCKTRPTITTLRKGSIIYPPLSRSLQCDVFLLPSKPCVCRSSLGFYAAQGVGADWDLRDMLSPSVFPAHAWGALGFGCGTFRTRFFCWCECVRSQLPHRKSLDRRI